MSAAIPLIKVQLHPLCLRNLIAPPIRKNPLDNQEDRKDERDDRDAGRDANEEGDTRRNADQRKESFKNAVGHFLAEERQKKCDHAADQRKSAEKLGNDDGEQQRRTDRQESYDDRKNASGDEPATAHRESFSRGGGSGIRAHCGIR